MTDIVERLRDKQYDCCNDNMRCNGDLMEEAADEIERLREALRFIVDETCEYAIINKLGDPEQQHSIKLARAALGEGK